MGFLTRSHPLTSIEIERYYQNEPRFNGVCSRNNLPKKIKGRVYVINLDEYADVCTDWIALFCKRSEIFYFDSLGVEHVPEEIKEFIRNKNIIANIFPVQENNSMMCEYFCIGFINFMFAGKNLKDFTSLLSKMNEIDKKNLTDQTKFRLNEINKIENYFNSETTQRKSCIKKLSKFVTTFDYIDKVLIILSATSGGVSIISLTSAAGAPVGIAVASFALIFSLTTGTTKKLLSITRNKKKKYYKIPMLAKNKLNSIEPFVSQLLTDMEISHEEFNTIMNEKKNMRRWKKNVRNISEKQENLRLNSVNAKA